MCFSHYGPTCILLPLSSFFLPAPCSNYYLAPVDSHDGQRAHSAANKWHQGDRRSTCYGPSLTHSWYRHSTKALLPTKPIALSTVTSNLLKVKPIYRQVLYVLICIPEILLAEMWNTLANTTYKLKKKHRWFVKLQVKKETQKAGVVSCGASRGVWFLSQNLHLKHLRHNTDPWQYISPTPGNLCTVNTCKDE